MASMLRHQANTSRADDDGNTSKNVHSRRSGFKEFLPWQKKGKGLQISKSHVTELLDSIHVPSLEVTNISHPPIFKGAYSDVYQGVFGGKIVAVKVIRMLGSTQTMDRKLRREIEVWWRLSHPNILPCLGFWISETVGGYGGILSPWCQNGNALAYLNTGPSLLRRVKIYHDVAKGLSYLHSFNPTVIHGDLKPANVLIDDDFAARLCDFGLVRLIPQDGGAVGATTTIPHHGTVRYLAHELVKDDTLPSTASDVYALACVGFECLYLKLPYSNIKGTDPNADYKIYREIEDGKPPATSPDDLNNNMRKLWDHFELCWNTDPQERPSVADVVQFLEENSRRIAEPLSDDLNIPTLSHIREHPVVDLTGRVKDISALPFAGGYSNIWRGTLEDGTLVAIKCVRDFSMHDTNALPRLRVQVGTWWCLEHENIVPLLGIVEDKKFGISPAMISPWYKNGTVYNYLNPRRPVRMAQRVKLFQDVAKGINYLHNFDVTKNRADDDLGAHEKPKPDRIRLVHGDLNPTNVLVDNDGVARICGFTLLRLVQESAPTGMQTTSSHTGAVRYMSYELISNDDDDDPRPTTTSDVYALACLGMEFIYGELPHAKILDTARNCVYKIMGAIFRGKPPAVRPANCSGAVSRLWDLFERCWSKEPSMRPDAATILQFLEENWENIAAELDK